MADLLTLTPDEAPIASSVNKGQSAQATAAAHLEHLARSFMDAVNARDWNPESEGWSFLSTCLNVVMAHPPAGHDRPVSRDIFRERLKHYADTNPTFRERVIDVSTDVDKYCAHGRVLMYHECLGFPEGVVMEMVSLLEFICLQGRWVCTRFSSVRGV